MKFDWCEYIKLAEEMANLAASTSTGNGSTDDTKSGKIEARLRSSISRAYYAAYCIARNYLRDVLNDPILTKGKTEEIQLKSSREIIYQKTVKHIKANWTKKDIERVHGPLIMFRIKKK